MAEKDEEFDAYNDADKAKDEEYNDDIRDEEDTDDEDFEDEGDEE